MILLNLNQAVVEVEVEEVGAAEVAGAVTVVAAAAAVTAAVAVVTAVEAVDTAAVVATAVVATGVPAEAEATRAPTHGKMRRRQRKLPALSSGGGNCFFPFRLGISYGVAPAGSRACAASACGTNIARVG